MSRIDRLLRLALGVVWLSTALAFPAQEKPVSPGRKASVLPPLPTPVDYFRELLAAKGPERERLLNSRPALQRPQFLAIIREYELCTSDERERRLQALELRFVITSMIRLAPTARTQAVQRLPEALRPMIRERLTYWDRLVPEVQQACLTNERIMRIVAYVSPGLTSPTA